MINPDLDRNPRLFLSLVILVLGRVYCSSEFTYYSYNWLSRYNKAFDNKNWIKSN